MAKSARPLRTGAFPWGLLVYYRAAGEAAGGKRVYVTAGEDAHDLGVVVTGLVGELGVDVDDAVGIALDGGADEDVVEDLGVAVKDVAVALVCGERLDQGL